MALHELEDNLKDEDMSSDGSTNGSVPTHGRRTGQKDTGDGCTSQDDTATCCEQSKCLNGQTSDDGSKCDDGLLESGDEHDATTTTGVEETERGQRSEGGWGWFVVLGAAIVNMMFGINYRVFGLVYLEMRDRFQASATASVWVGGVNLLLGGFCGPVAAWLLERYSHRAVTAVGTTLAVVGMIGTGYMPNLPLTYITYGIFTGVGIALAHVSAVALVGQYFEKRKALALAIQSVTSGLSALIFSPLMALLFTEFGYAGTFLIFGGILTHMYIASALFRPLQDNDTSNKAADKDDEPVQTKRPALCSGCGSMRVAVQSPVFISFYFLLLSVTAARAVTSSFLPALALEFGTTLNEAAFLPAISGVAASAGSLVIGAVFDTKPIKKYRVYLYSVLTFMIGGTLLGMPFTNTFCGLATLTAINGVISTAIFAQQMTVLTDLLGKKHAVAGFGLVRVALALGSILGRSLSAIFVDTMATNKFGFYITSSLPMLGSLVFVVVALVHSRRNSDVVTETVEKGVSV